jgi:hypothetical protein
MELLPVSIYELTELTPKPLRRKLICVRPDGGGVELVVARLELFDRVHDALGILPGKEHSSFAFDDRFGRAAVAVGDYRSSTSLCFDG